MKTLLMFIGAFVINLGISAAVSFVAQAAGAPLWTAGAAFGVTTTLLWQAYWAWRFA
jgi:hypothetical protein